MSVIEKPEQIDLPVVSGGEAKRREVLLRAAELIEERGWTKGGQGMMVSGPYCVLGAIGAAANLEIRFSVTNMHEAAAFIGENRRASAYYVWNDVHVRDGEQVAKVLRAMANGKSFDEATA